MTYLLETKVLAIVLAASLPFFGQSSTKGVAIERQRVGKWTYAIATDRFTNGKSCHVRRGDVLLSGGVVTLRFKPSLDTGMAWYRVDDAAARPVSDFTPVLRRMGALPIASGDLANPSGGLVRLPFEAVKNAGRLAVRIDQNRSARSFNLTGLAAAAETSAARGCDPTRSR